MKSFGLVLIKPGIILFFTNLYGCPIQKWNFICLVSGLKLQMYQVEKKKQTEKHVPVGTHLLTCPLKRSSQNIQMPKGKRGP